MHNFQVRIFDNLRVQYNHNLHFIRQKIFFNSPHLKYQEKHWIADQSEKEINFCQVSRASSFYEAKGRKRTVLLDDVDGEVGGGEDVAVV